MGTSPPLVVLPYRLERSDADGIVIHAFTADARLELSPDFQVFLDGFAAPTSPEAFITAHEDVADRDSLAAGIELLQERGILVDAAWRDALRDVRCERATIAAFASERAPITALVDGAADLVFAGFPVDIATTGAAGARNGPAAIRFHSRQRSLEAGRVLDEATGVVRAVNPGRALDVGDLAVRAGEGIDSIIPRIATVAELAARAGAVLVSFGGDHAITYPLLMGLVRARRAQRARGLCVVHFDAHSDLPRGELSPFDARHSHATFMRHVVDDGLVERVVQIGLRNIVPAPPPDSPRLRLEPAVVGGLSAATIARSDLLALVPSDLDVYITVDIDVVDPAFAPDTGTPLPGGMLPSRLVELVGAIVEARQLAGIDVVEVAGDAIAANRTASLAALVLHDAMLRRFGAVENPGSA